MSTRPDYVHHELCSLAQGDTALSAVSLRPELRTRTTSAMEDTGGLVLQSEAGLTVEGVSRFNSGVSVKRLKRLLNCGTGYLKAAAREDPTGDNAPEKYLGWCGKD